MDKKTKKVNFPVSPPEGDGRLFPDEYVTNAASATECTGLVQVPPEFEDELTSYEDIYSYRQKEVHD